MKSLNLSTYIPTFWDVTLPDGTVVNLKKPTQKMILEIAASQKKAADINKNPTAYSVEQAMEISDDLVLKILNNNKENKTFKKDYIEKNFTNEMITALFNGYIEFVAEVNSDPNS